MRPLTPWVRVIQFAEDPQLKQLEEALARFNLFDAIGATHKELWHSDFLAFLLNPVQGHGLGDEFTRRFLREAVRREGSGQLRAHWDVISAEYPDSSIYGVR